ncbi:MAG: glycine cleavage system protein GcvH [Bacillota bacterium]
MHWHFPEDLKYTGKHEWVKMTDQNGKKTVLIGITDYAQDKLGKIVFVELPETGREVKPGESLAVIESVKAVSDVFSPVAGSVLEVNEGLFDTPELLNEDPYAAGWIVRLAIADEAEYAGLMSVSEYLTFVRQAEEEV